VHKMNT